LSGIGEDSMGNSKDWWEELLSEVVCNLETDGKTYLPELVTELASSLGDELMGSLKPAEFREMAQRLGKLNPGTS
jgi:hypothetical protein